MKPFLYLWLLLTACTSSPDRSIQLPPNVFMEKGPDTALKNMNGIWMFKGTKYNGYIIEKDSNAMVAKLSIIDGKENGIAYGWFKNGKKKYERAFLNGNREGIHKGWYQNGSLAFQYFFHDDKYEGEQLTFYKSGNRWQSLNYFHGYEEGKQKSWNDSGRVINNFTVKNGKLYGVIGRYDCMSIMEK